MRKYSFKLLLLFFVIVGIENTAFTQKNLKKSRSKFKLGNIFGFGKKKDNTLDSLEQQLKIVEELRKKIGETKEPRPDTTSLGPGSTRIEQLQALLNETSLKIQILQKKINDLNPFSKTDKQELEHLEEELTNLYNNYIKPYKIIYQNITHPKVITTDNAFATGKADLNENAKKQIKKFVTEWEDEINVWRNFKNTQGSASFSSSPIIIRINIIGYADMQGKGSEAERMKYNQQLSEKRANNIKLQLKKEIAALREKYNLDIEYITIGKGEELPIGVKDKELIDNPERRRVIITTAIFPEELIK